MRHLLLIVLVCLLCGCTEVSVLTGDELVGHEGEIVNLRGTVLEDKKICTKSICTEDNPCCNNCQSSLIINSSDVKVYLEGIKCSGTNCQMDCGGFVHGNEYVISGTYSVRRNFNFIEYMRHS